MEISGNFEDPLRLDLVVLKKTVIFWGFINLFRITSEENWSYFLNNAAKTWLYGLKISENIEIEQVF